MIASPLLPYLLLAGVVAATSAGLGGYLKGRADGRALERATQVTEAALVEKVSQASQLAAAREIAAIQIKHTTIRQQVEKETREIPVYRDCRHADGVLDHLNAALIGAVPAGGGKLSTTLSTSRSELRGDDAETARPGEPVSPVPGSSAGGD